MEFGISEEKQTNRRRYRIMAAYNGRFGASGAFSRPKGCADLEAFAPVQAAVEAQPSPNRWDVRHQQGLCVVYREN